MKVNSDLHRAESYTVYTEELANNRPLQPEACNPRKQNTIWFTVNFYTEKQQRQVVVKFGDRKLARQGFPYHETFLVVLS